MPPTSISAQSTCRPRVEKKTRVTRHAGVYFASIAAFEAFRNFGGQLLIDVRPSSSTVVSPGNGF